MTRKKNHKRREAAKTKKAASRSNSDASMDMAISPTESTATEQTAITATTTARSSSDEAISHTANVDHVATPDSGSQADDDSDGDESNDNFDNANDEFEPDQQPVEQGTKVDDDTPSNAAVANDILLTPAKTEEDKTQGTLADDEEASIEEPSAADVSLEVPVEFKEEPVFDTTAAEDTTVPQASETIVSDSTTTAPEDVLQDELTRTDEPIPVDEPVAADEPVPADEPISAVEPVSADEEIAASEEIPADDVFPLEDGSSDKPQEEDEAETIAMATAPIATLAAIEEEQDALPSEGNIVIPPLPTKEDGLPSSDHLIWAAEVPLTDSHVQASVVDQSPPVEAVDKSNAELAEAEVAETTFSDDQEHHQSSSRAPPKANYINEGRVISNESISNLPSMEAASESVATVAIQCLERDKDMELSYVAILSAITVLKQMRDEATPLSDDHLHKISAMYSHVIQLCTQDSARDGLAEETVRQGVLTPENLFLQLHHSILDAGFRLEDKDHLAISRVFLHYKRAERALQVMAYIPSDRWKGAEYRHAIQCRMASRPRQQADIDALLAEYQNREDQSKVPLIQEWYRLCQQSARWEDAKIQYERRRARLVDAPNNIERLSNVSSVPSTSIDLGSSPLSSPYQGRHERTTSSGSTSTTASSPGHQRSTSTSSHQRTPSVNAASWPSGAPATHKPPSSSTTPVSKGPFSFFSNFKFPGTGSKAAAPQEQQPAALPSSIHANHHLTVLDNNMLEECVKFKGFEYGWRRIYERMGHQLEDKDTAKIVMRLCKRAFLGFGGAGPEAPGSPNVQAKDIFDLEDEAALHIAEAIRQVAPGDRSMFAQDPEIWEARAWAVYNKAMMSPQSLGTSATPSHHHHHLHHHPHHTGGQSPGAQTAAAVSMDPNQPIASLNSYTAMSVFLHDILTIATCSPEKSSRYLKAYRVYSTMRSDPALQLHLRDPYVMKVVLKAIYDSVLSIVHAQEQGIEFIPPPKADSASPSPPLPSSAAAKAHHRRSSTNSLGRVQAMSIGPLLDLAFEIYADLRDTGAIRPLSWISSPSVPGITPNTPAVRTPQGNLALFFNPSSSSSATDPTANTEGAAATTSTSDLDNAPAVTTASVSPRASLSGAPVPVFQELSPLLVPSAHARVLPNELYLALLQLCIQVPVWEISSKVVQTIVSDIKLGMSRDDDSKLVVDKDMAAALQCFHDTWMCTVPGSDEEKSRQCSFQAWMYRDDEAAQQGQEVDGSEVPSCNEHEYWNLWSKQDSRLTRLVYSPSRVSVLVEHVEQTLEPTTAM
ncbi:hypothetical protein BGZ73_003978 [Actinomortierella ambigua]|nr:hypothetical protein BGZ73_003978 [Actinomortierella ambigua]